MHSVGTAIVGCGNISSFYFHTVPKYPILKVLGVMDRSDERAEKYARYYAVRKYPSLDAVLDDNDVELVVNLTNPSNHYSVSRACLEAGKHVYSEKPLAMTFAQADELVQMAEEKGLVIAAAPSRIFGATAQTIWKAIRAGVVGKIHAVYAEMDGGLIHRMEYKSWKNELDMPWPYTDEFEVGCTIEHAGYPVSWLTAFFGEVETVTTFATCQIPDKLADVVPETHPPDLTVACMKFKSGVVARLTSSWLAPHDHSMRLFGDTGVLSTPDVWRPRSPVYVTRRRVIRIGPKAIPIPWRETYPMSFPPREDFVRHSALRSGLKSISRAMPARFLHLRKRVDFCLGPSEVAMAVREQRPCRLPAKYCLHNTEVVLAIHNATGANCVYRVQTSFEPIEPMPWALP